ncbi:hypothetical protein BDQ94DRAFT_145491 [Aspergillus welwitschiae]|uniref:Uncharacterized protein n=1 Tax=Aspergillus welwitschiae TaxID=1341132 RepID=A0A3F3PYU4_9EURO|nr:hypothetical protein BDQ94DRAFT_145491 [Aspergillus welwitschiae]RDH32110.1 hypothetical protein BDQ94DRAFT_145491 [Aspergillus welwitschiae]
MDIQAPLVRLKFPVPAFYIFEVWGDAKISDGLRDFSQSFLQCGYLLSIYEALEDSSFRSTQYRQHLPFRLRYVTNMPGCILKILKGFKVLPSFV